MKAYLHDDKTGGVIGKICKKNGLDIITPADIQMRKKTPEGVNFFLDEVDLLILEITHPSQIVQYIIAQASLTKTPTLCLYGKNQTPTELISYIKTRPTPRAIKTFSYITTEVEERIRQFIDRIDPVLSDEHVTSIKFTLRMTPFMERYLQWLSDTAGVTKADYLRDTMTEQAHNDAAFQAYQTAQQEIQLKNHSQKKKGGQ